jgi:hypothetical protein
MFYATKVYSASALTKEQMPFTAAAYQNLVELPQYLVCLVPAWKGEAVAVGVALGILNGFMEDVP